MSAKNGAAAGDDTIKQKTLISSNPRNHVDFAREIADLGFTTLIFHTAGPDQMAFIEGYGRDVVRQLKVAQARAA